MNCSISIKKVTDRKDMREFVEFPLRLYKGCSSFVPGLYQDEIDTLTESSNPAYAFCSSALFLAIKDGKTAGRVAAIINRSANERWNHKEVRFGWFDFIDDPEVSKALLDAVMDYGRQNGMETVTGPLGFVDFDPEGMLVEGFEHISTSFLRHNHPYYKVHMENMGFEKEIDWLEYKVYVPETMPERYSKMAQLVAQRYNLHVRKIRKSDIFGKEQVGQKIFDLINRTYSNLYNYSMLTKELVDKFVKTYIGLLDLRYISLVENEHNELIAVGITMPSITRALQKCDGKIFPFGWYHLAKSMYFKKEESIELLLIGVSEEYRNKGVHAMIFNEIMQIAHEDGYKWAETNAELETNHNVQALWSGFDYEQTKRRRIYKKNL